MNKSHPHSLAGRSTRLTRFRACVTLLLTSVLVGPASPAHAAQDPLDLGKADSFAVLAGQGLTNTGATKVTGTAGNLGSHPLATFTGVDGVETTGIKYTASSPIVADAKASLVSAYDIAAGREPSELIVGDLGGQTLGPGVYYSGSSIGLTGTLTLDAENNADAVFIFKAVSQLTTLSASRVTLINGASPCNVFWQVGSSAVLGTYSFFAGNVLALTSITAPTGANVTGKLLAIEGTVTLDANTIVSNRCAAAIAPEIDPEVDTEGTPGTTPENNPAAPKPAPGEETVVGGGLPNTGDIEWLIALGAGGAALTAGVVDIVRRRKAG
jgi:hypothetical protein